MATLLIRYLNIIMAGLISGIMLGIWLGYNPKTLSVETYVEQQQSVIKSLNTLMPLLGLVTILLTLFSGFLQKNNPAILITLLIAALLLIISGLVTKLGNQPINSIVSTWNKNNSPADWTEFRDKWWSFHIIRTLTALIAFCLIVWTGIRKD